MADEQERLIDSAHNAKTSLVELCQRVMGRSMNKGDVHYITKKTDEGLFEAKVVLVCMGGQEFEGEALENEKEAQHSAALIALNGLQEEFLSKLQGQKATDVKLVKGVNGQEASLLVDTEDVTVKSKLREAIKQLQGKDMAAGDVVYDMQTDADGLNTCTVKAPNLPDGWGEKVWTGPTSVFKRDAQLGAARVALAEIMEDETLGPQVDLSNVMDVDQKRIQRKECEKKAEARKKEEKRRKAEEEGDKPLGKKATKRLRQQAVEAMEWDPWMIMLKGKGKGKAGMDPWSMMDMMGGMMEMMWGKGKGKGKGRGKGK